jgi:hypothetical protein
VQARDHLGHPGRAAGELEDGHAVGVEPGLDPLDGLARGAGVELGAQPGELVEHEHRAQGRVVALLLAGEPHQVARPLDQVRDGADAAADLADLVARGAPPACTPAPARP